MDFDINKLIELKKSYNNAINNSQEIFIFEDNELLVDYAKYLIEYLESVLV